MPVQLLLHKANTVELIFCSPADDGSGALQNDSLKKRSVSCPTLKHVVDVDKQVRAAVSFSDHPSVSAGR